MTSRTIILLESDAVYQRALQALLRLGSNSVETVASLSQLRSHLGRVGGATAVLDMELVTLNDVGRLSRDFPGLRIICHHRLADDKFWAAAMNAGATDVCSSGNPRAIVEAVLRFSPETLARSAA